MSGLGSTFGHWLLGIAIAAIGICANSLFCPPLRSETPTAKPLSETGAMEANGWVFNDKGEATLIFDASNTTRAGSLTRQFLPLQLFTGEIKLGYQADWEEAKRLDRQIEQLHNQGKYREAIPLTEKVLAITEKVLGKEDSLVAIILNNSALLYLQQGNYQQAEPLLQRALTIVEKIVGKENSLIAAILNNLALLYLQQGNYQQAEPLLQRSLTITEKVVGKEHPNVAVLLYGLAALYFEQGNYQQAEPLRQRFVAIVEKVVGKKHSDVALNFNSLASLYREQRNYQQAEPLLLNNFKVPVFGIWLPSVSAFKSF